MNMLWPLVIGFALGFLLIFLFRLGQGSIAYCTKCGQKHWLGPKNTKTSCKKCGSPLKIERKPALKSGKAVDGRKKKK
jgi:uncharacterized paraquat-inducible protein A